MLQLSGTKTYYAPAAEVAASSLPALQAGRLVAFKVRIEPDFLGALLVYCPPLKRNPSDCRGLTSQMRTCRELSFNRSESDEARLLQLRVFDLGLLVDGNLGVGVFPEGQEVFVRGERTNAGRVGICALRVLGTL